MAIKQAKRGKKTQVQAKKVKKVSKPMEVDDDFDMESEEDSSEEEVPVKGKANGAKVKFGKKNAPREEDSEEESEDEEGSPLKKGTPKKIPKKGMDDEDEESDEEEEEEEEEEEMPKKQKAKVPKKAGKLQEDESDEEEDDDNIVEEMPKKGKAKVVKKVTKAQEESEDDDEEEEDDDEEEEEDDEEEEEDDDEEEEEDDDDDEEIGGKGSKKRKAKDVKKGAKKQKVEEVVIIKVSNLPESVSDEKVVAFLKKKGVETTSFKRNVKRGCCFLQLADPETLETAVGLSGQKLKGSQITVEKAEPKGEASKESPDKAKQDGGRTKIFGEEKDPFTLFMKNLPYEIGEVEIKKVFPNAVDVRLAKRPDGTLRGFGFVEFSTEEEVNEAMESKQGTDIGGRAVILDFMGSKAKNKPSGDKAKSKGEPGKTRVLFVGNLSFDTTAESLKEAFEGCTDARIIYRDDGRSKGIGFLEYETPEEAKAALESLNGVEVDGRSVNLDFATERGSGGGGGRGGFRGGRGGFRGGRGGSGDRRGGRGGRGGFRGGRGGNQRRNQSFEGSRKTFDYE